MRLKRFRKNWARFWMQWSGTGAVGRLACLMAGLVAPPYYGKVFLSRLSERGYVSPFARIHHSGLDLGGHVYLDEGVLIYEDNKGGPVVIAEDVHLHRDTTIQTGRGGRVEIGAGTHVQPRCQFSAYEGPIRIGQRVEIAPNCAFYSYDHQIQPGQPVREQPVTTRGGIEVGDDAWLGYGVVVLDGVKIGKGAVVGAGAVVTRDIPENGIAAGIPARVVKMRDDLSG